MHVYGQSEVLARLDVHGGYDTTAYAYQLRLCLVFTTNQASFMSEMKGLTLSGAWHSEDLRHRIYNINQNIKMYTMRHVNLGAND